MKILNYAFIALLLVVSSCKTDDENLTNYQFGVAIVGKGLSLAGIFLSC